MNAILITPPAAEPVALADAKAWLRIDTNAEDTAISALIAAARQAVEAATRRCLVTQGWRIVLDAWPFVGAADGSLGALRLTAPPALLEARLPLAPLATVSAVRVYDAGGQPQALAAALWRLADAPDKARLVFTAAPPNPGVVAGGIEIDVVAGYGAASDVPAALRQAILMLVADWFENRGDADAGGPQNLPKRVTTLVAPYRRGRLA
jgi:hypothetical protein